MKIYNVLIVVGVIQVFLVVLTLALLLANRVRSFMRARKYNVESSGIMEPVRRFLIGNGTAEEVAKELRSMPHRDAVLMLLSILADNLPESSRQELAAVLREEEWVRKVVARAGSRFWWRRLEAARVLAIVSERSDRRIVRKLVNDPHPAVQTAATACLANETDVRSFEVIMDQLADKAFVVRLYQFSVLREQWQIVVPMLMQRLKSNAEPRDLVSWIDLAEALDQPEPLALAAELHSHPDAMVRAAVARALRKYFHPSTPELLHRMLEDNDWRVRSQAARALGIVGARNSIVRLADALSDSAWWVRFHSALALAALGESGRVALRSARGSSDRYAAEMAAMVSGLSSGAVLELSEQ